VDYRQTLADNLRVLMTVSGFTSETLKAHYIDGPKKGRTVSVRTIRNVANNREGASGLGLDALAAIAARFGIQVYQLLVPGLDPRTQPVGMAETWIENEVQRRLAARLHLAVPLLRNSRSEVKQGELPTAAAADRTNDDRGLDLEVTAKHRGGKATGKEQTPGEGRSKTKK